MNTDRAYGFRVRRTELGCSRVPQCMIWRKSETSDLRAAPGMTSGYDSYLEIIGLAGRSKRFRRRREASDLCLVDLDAGSGRVERPDLAVADDDRVSHDVLRKEVIGEAQPP